MNNYFNYKVVKSNKIVNSKQSFSLDQFRMLALLSSKITENDDEFCEHEISILDILGKNSSDKVSGQQYNRVRQAAEDLINSSISIEFNNVWRAYSLITYAEGAKGRGYVTLKFSSDVKPFFLNLKKRYTSYFLRDVLMFKHAPSFRIYELMKQYYPQIKVREIEVGRLRELLGFENKYKLYGNFKTKVLSPAIKEINKLSDISVNFVENKKSKRVISISFHIRKNTSRPHQREIDNCKKTGSNRFLDEYSYKRLVKKYDSDYLNFCMDYVDGKKDVSNKKGYLLNALRFGYLLPSFNEKKSKSLKVMKENNRRSLLRRRENLKQKIVNEFDNIRNKVFDKYQMIASDEDLAIFLFELEESEDFYEKEVFSRFMAKGESNLDIRYFIRWYILNYGNDEEKMIAQANIKLYAKYKYNLEWD
ncbi:replication initiation protein [Aureibacter tunicatorum]|uniref:Plasmid replication initiation protein n=1 Tax=Aureibacter tunicatorum TaxID=866807 RepID=A0AAE4BT99_9BACT|nr:replication initiation protein [Aureibacter tunicatorum]MDR6241974.1 plasmid replication initiation protein [Aureibacter tunicatorum]BDD07527.1 hypothetical protein AUTU_50100 [Aureibacter tunicatorum]